MTLLKMALKTALGGGNFAFRGQSHKAVAPFLSATCVCFNWQSQRSLSSMQLTKAMELISTDDIRLVKDKADPNAKSLRLEESRSNKPLAVILAWLMCQRKHIVKHANFYLDQGFDVLTVKLTPWQLLWPVKGSQLVAGEIRDFLYLNQSYQPLLLHGFSIGGYLWGEAMVKLQEDKKYLPIHDRIAGQIWDSVADLCDIPHGMSKAVFPKNPVLCTALEQYAKYHLKTFHEAATSHYIRSSQFFHSGVTRAPALFLCSKTDPVGTAQGILKVKEGWDKLGVETYIKCWDKSPHVSHFRVHPKEYRAEVTSFLDRVGLLAHPEKIQAKL